MKSESVDYPDLDDDSSYNFLNRKREPLSCDPSESGRTEIKDIYSKVSSLYAKAKMTSLTGKLVDSIDTHSYERNPYSLSDRTELKALIKEIFEKFKKLENVLDYNETIGTNVEVDQLNSIIRTRYNAKFCINDLKSIVFFAPQLFNFINFNERFVLRRNFESKQLKSEVLSEKQVNQLVTLHREKVFFEALKRFEENVIFVEKTVPFRSLPEFQIEIFREDTKQIEYWLLGSRRKDLLEKLAENIDWAGEKEFSCQMSRDMIEKLKRIIQRKELSNRLDRFENDELVEKFKGKKGKVRNLLLNYLMMTNYGQASIKELTEFMTKQKFVRDYKATEKMVMDVLLEIGNEDARIKVLPWKDEGWGFKLLS